MRLAARAAADLVSAAAVWLGGKLSLPEPFGLRHAWADKPWRHRFMADDALRAARRCCGRCTPRLSRYWRRTGWTRRSSGRGPSFLSTAVQDASPRKADVYDA
ncbi:hypothetical protein GCM10023238_27920 [Streptomyces heliomycini]